MSKARLQRVIDHYRAQLAANEAQAERQLSEAYARVLKTIEPALSKLYDDMANALAEGEQIPLSWLYEAGRLQQIKKLLASQVNGYGALSQLTVGQLLHEAVALGTKAAQAQLNETVPAGVHWDFGVPSPKALANLTGAMQAGSPLADLFSGFGEEAAANVSGILMRGLTLGQNPREIARDVEQALDIPRARALTISQDQMVRAYRGANHETYRANSDVVAQWRWTCAKSPRTCAACIAMDGTIHSIDEDMGSHVRCRCVPTPVTRSWSDILADSGVDISGLDDLEPVQPQSGADWLKEQSELVQRQVLGAKYQGWANGDFSLKDLVGRSTDEKWGSSIYEKSLKQLTKAR